MKNIIKPYVETGKIIKQNPSKFHQDLDDTIKNQQTSSSQVILENNSRYLSVEFKSSLYKTFTALVAPSLTGKTQSAFAIKSKLPLYFVFASNQRIYGLFDGLSARLREFAKDDVKAVKTHLVNTGRWRKPENETSLSSYYVSIEDLLCIDVKLKSLGLLRALFAEADAFLEDPSNNRDDWWYHFTKNRKITCKPITITEYLIETEDKNYEDKYVIFLDEFNDDEDLVFIKTLCRFFRYSCVVSSKNANTANLTVTSPPTSARGKGPTAWSVVFTDIGPFQSECLKLNDKFKEAIDYLIESASKTSDKEGLKMQLFANYLKEQCLASRPGLAHLIMESICELKSRDLNEPNQFKFDEFFERFINELYSNLKAKKPEAFYGPDSVNSCARIIDGDHFENDYYKYETSANSNSDADVSHRFYRNYKFETSENLKSIADINHHFFHMTNPNKPPEGPFLLAKLADWRNPFRSALCPSPSRKREPLNISSYFDPKEELLLLACLYSGFSCPTSKPLNLYLSTIKRSGNALESLVAQSIINASHQSSFRGIDFEKFLSKTLWNFNLPNETLKRIRLLIDSKISKSLENLSVPFLFPANLKVPEIFNEMFPKSESSIKFGSYFRTAENDSNNAVFDLTYKEPSTVPVKAVVEAKSNLSGSDYGEILTKFVKYTELSENVGTKFPVHLTFCLGFAELNRLKNDETVSKLQTLGQSHKINFLKLVPCENLPEEHQFNADNDVAFFKLVPWNKSKFPIHSDPELSAIIIETDQLLMNLGAETQRKL